MIAEESVAISGMIVWALIAIGLIFGGAYFYVRKLRQRNKAHRNTHDL